MRHPFAEPCNLKFPPTCRTLSRRSLLSFVTVGLLPNLTQSAAFCQTEPASLEPGQGEVLIEGLISGGSRKERKMTLLVDRVVSHSGTQTDLKPPRARDVQLSDKTTLVNLRNAQQTLVPEGLSLNLRVSVIGKDLGNGQIIPARLILVDAKSVEQRTLLENGQLAVATQTFTRLGDKAWWNFRCSDAARATMTAYRSGLIMVVDQAAQQYDVQFQQGDVAIAEGDIVTVAFRAKADRVRPLHVEAQATGGNYPDIGLVRDIALGKDWQPYSFTFTARNIGARNQVVFGVGQAIGSVWLESVSLSIAPSGKKPVVVAKPAPVAKSGTTPFTGALVSQIDLFSVIGKRYDFVRGGEQPFTLLLTSEENPVQLVPITLTAQKETQRLQTEDGFVTVRKLDWKRAEDKKPIGYLLIGPDGEMIKSENEAAFFAEPLYRMQGPAAKTKTGWDMQMLEPYRDRWRVESIDKGWKISVLMADGRVAGFVETDATYNPTRIHCPINGDINGRVFSATVSDGKIDWDLPLLPAR